MRMSLKDNVEVLIDTVKTIMENDREREKQWEEIVPELAHWHSGRLSAFSFVRECLEKYIEQDKEIK